MMDGTVLQNRYRAYRGQVTSDVSSDFLLTTNFSHMAWFDPIDLQYCVSAFIALSLHTLKKSLR